MNQSTAIESFIAFGFGLDFTVVYQISRRSRDYFLKLKYLDIFV